MNKRGYHLASVQAWPERRGQVTIFIIIGILIVSAVILFFVLRKPGTAESGIPADLQPPYTAFLSCLEDETNLGISLIETQGGYIELPAFEPGSAYMPFSSILNFAGAAVPYWYYVSGNNIQREQVPALNGMEDELAKFVEGRINGCDLSDYETLGFDISRGEETKAEVKINEGSVEINLEMDMAISNAGENAEIDSHLITVDSKLGALYNDAKDVYLKEQSELFLEKYGVDALGIYAPVDGVELSCSPLVWSADDVFDRLQEAIEANTLALKSSGESDDYFLVEGLNPNVRFINSRNWPSTFEVAPSEGPVLISKPVGNQPGLGILGFCYVPYHFVYDVKYSVLVQVYEGDEIFQFPMAVVIQGNKPREPISSPAFESAVPELCQYKNTRIEVSAKDINGNFVDADISYECSNTVCYLGKTQNGILSTDFPQCANGRIIARAEGYRELEEQYSSIEPGSVELYLDKEHSLGVRVLLDGKQYNKQVILSFISNGSSTTISYPEQNTVELSQGEYEIQAYIYDESTLKLDSSVIQQCVEVPRGGIGGIIGLTEERCFDVEIPEQIISSALSGGGKTKTYVSDSTLERSGFVEISAQSLPKPESLEQLQDNYILFEDKNIDVYFK
jgi:hypothetical protein